MPETVADMIKLHDESLSFSEVLFGSANDGGEIQYSMLEQNEDNALFGKENFDNVSFDYDDFSSSSEDELGASTDFTEKSRN